MRDSLPALRRKKRNGDSQQTEERTSQKRGGGHARYVRPTYESQALERSMKSNRPHPPPLPGKTGHHNIVNFPQKNMKKTRGRSI